MDVAEDHLDIKLGPLQVGVYGHTGIRRRSQTQRFFRFGGQHIGGGHTSNGGTETIVDT